MRVLLIDGLNLIRRVYAGVPVADDPGSRHETIVKSCVLSLQRALRLQPATHVVCAMDSRSPSWRLKAYPDYKKNRSPMPDELRDCLPAILDAFHDIGVRASEVEGLEADDVIATIARRVVQAGGAVTVVSTDKSFCQLLELGVQVYDHFADVEHDHNWVSQRFGVEPGQLVDLFALAGDSSLGIPGVRSVGIHTAVKLLHDYGDLEGVLSAAAKIPGRLGNKINEGRDDARMARRLVALHSDAELGINLKDFRIEA